MNKRIALVFTAAALVATLVTSCVATTVPLPTEPAATAAMDAAATATALPDATAATTGATPDTRPTVSPPADDSRPLAQLTPDERADRFSGPAPMWIITGTTYLATIVTDKGNIVAELYQDTPLSTNNFVTLAKDGYYDGLTFHRVEPGFVIQGGDPKGDGSGGPGYTIPAEIIHNHPKGALAWARTGDQVNPERRSSGSQFYITLDATPFLDGGYTSFGYVIEGMDVAEKIAVGDKIERIDISTADVSRLPTPTPTAVPAAPAPAEGRPLAQEPLEQRGSHYNIPPEMAIDATKSYQATISSSKGEIVLDLDAAKATKSVNNFVILANLGFYDGMPVAYVQPQPGSYAVIGSPASRPDSDIGYTLDIEEDAAASQVVTGTVAYYPIINQSTQAVKASGSQFFISLSELPSPNAPLNVFGSVVSGLDVAVKLQAGDVITKVTILEK